jgi:outer membrane lipoprotein-sorting protein
MSVMASRPVLRWAVPAGVVVAVLGAGVLSSELRASASVTLPERSPAQLLVDVQQANLTGVSGTVVERADLGLPALPQGLGGDGSANLNSLVSGSHTLRVWYSGPDKVRVALLGSLGESDIIRNGADAWIWSSSDNSAVHLKSSGKSAGKDTPAKPKPVPDPSDLAITPEQAANFVLAALAPTTVVGTEPSALVADRPAYRLTLSPRDSASLIAKVRVSIDGTEHVPTQVEVFAKGQPDSAAFSIGFSQVTFARPDNERFSFTPPPGAKVTEGSGTTGGTPDKSGTAGSAPKTAVVGTGWTSVLAARVSVDALLGGATGSGKPADSGKSIGDGKPADRHGDAAAVGALLNTLPQVHGPWGSGRLLESRLFSVLITDDGRVLAGAVTGDRLQAAAADPAAALK